MGETEPKIPEIMSPQKIKELKARLHRSPDLAKKVCTHLTSAYAAELAPPNSDLELGEYTREVANYAQDLRVDLNGSLRLPGEGWFESSTPNSTPEAIAEALREVQEGEQQHG